MLYDWYEAQHTMLGPWRIAAEAARGWYGHPFSPLSYSPIARRVTAGSELFLRLTQRYEKPAWNIDSTIVDGKGKNRRKDPRVLLVAPLSGHHATLLRDTVRALLPDHEVWITDWVDARM